MRITDKRLRQIIREELLQEEGITDTEFVKGLRDKAADIAGKVPVALNDEMATAIKNLSNLSASNRAAFGKLVALIAKYAEEGGEPAEKEESEDLEPGTRPAAGGEEDPEDLLLGNPDGKRRIVRDDQRRS